MTRVEDVVWFWGEGDSINKVNCKLCSRDVSFLGVTYVVIVQKLSSFNLWFMSVVGKYNLYQDKNTRYIISFPHFTFPLILISDLYLDLLLHTSNCTRAQKK